MKYSSIKITTQINNVSLIQIVDAMMKVQSQEFIYDSVCSLELTQKMKEDPICYKWDYLIFNSPLLSLYNAKVHVRYNELEIEVFNITSTNPCFAILNAKQYQHVLDKFKEFIGIAISQLL